MFIIACAGVAGCHRARPLTETEQFAALLNKFYANEPACLWQQQTTLDETNYGAALPTPSEAKALVDAGLIAAAPHGYALTGSGRKVWRPNVDEPRFGNLCYGTWHVERIDALTPRHDEVYGDVTDAQFFTVISSPAAWTRLPEMHQAFPLMAIEVSQSLPHLATLKHTDKGWQVASASVDTAFP